MGNSWFISIETIRDAFETDVFEQPGKVAKLPDALGGDPKGSDALRAEVKDKDNPVILNKNAFFELLWAKAHFLMLPKPIVGFMKDNGRVFISEEAPTRPGAKADTHCNQYSGQAGKWAQMHIPGASDALARAGSCLGPGCDSEDPYETRAYEILARIYHEMTHAWLCLQEFSDEAIKKLYNDGGRAYTGSTGIRGTQFNKDTAFTEAAGDYVEDRVLRWCTALWALAQASQDPKEVLRWKLPDIEKKYDAPKSRYGIVGGEEIDSPALSDDLRASINREILDGRPLTKPFRETPLARVRETLWGLGP